MIDRQFNYVLYKDGRMVYKMTDHLIIEPMRYPIITLGKWSIAFVARLKGSQANSRTPMISKVLFEPKSYTFCNQSFRTCKANGWRVCKGSAFPNGNMRCPYHRPQKYTSKYISWRTTKEYK